MKILIPKIDSFIQRMRWKAHFFVEPNNSDRIQSFGFESEKTPKPHPAMIAFENDLCNLANSLEFTKYRSDFQKRLQNDIKEIRNSPDMFVFADKTTNIYKMPPDSHDKMLLENVTSAYKLAPSNTERKINLEAKSIAKSLKLQDRIECIAEKTAFITLKDHKENFNTAPKCRLLNPAKSEIGIVSKHHLQAINNSIRTITNLNQWRNTSTVIDWFKSIELKESMRFIQFDIVDFYPSISEKLLDNALNFAKSIVEIDQETIKIIKHACKSILFTNDKVWVKKSSDLFDVTMGSFHGAELCELTGLFILHQLRERFPDVNLGLYRDDGLGCCAAQPGPARDRMRKEITELFKANGLEITICMNATRVDFLDVTFDLVKELYYPFKKPNNDLLYINCKSNHPPNIIKQLPIMIEKRLSDLSFSSKEFNESKDAYEKALKDSGYNTKLVFRQPQARKRTRSRSILWFNPPFNAALSTNIGKQFLSLIDKHFPPHNKFHKIFNRNTIKISYSCTPNMKSIINSHNKSLNNPPTDPTMPCNCRNKAACPMEGECRRSAIVYKATISANDGTPPMEYIGSTENEFKTRFANHKTSFNNYHRRSATKLSQEVWRLKAEDKPTDVSWVIQHKSRPYRCGTRRCDLCTSEKLAILRNDPSRTLNRRSEIANKCKHRGKYKLGNVK